MKLTQQALEGIDRLRREGRVTETGPQPVEALPLVDTISERDFMAAVLDLARRRGWRCYHPFDSRKSAPGWPDVFAVRGVRAIAAELKTESGRLTAEQANWLELLALVPGIEAYTWRPSDWPTILRALE